MDKDIDVPYRNKNNAKRVLRFKDEHSAFQRGLTEFNTHAKEMKLLLICIAVLLLGIFIATVFPLS